MYKLLFLLSVLVFITGNTTATRIGPDGMPLAKKTHNLSDDSDGREKRRKQSYEFDFAAVFGNGESSSEVSSDEYPFPSSIEGAMKPSAVVSFAGASSQQPASLGSITDDERSTLSFHPSIDDDEVRAEPPQVEDTMHEVGNTLYFVNGNGLITAKMRGDGEVINVAHENKFWRDDHSETEDEGDSETEEQDTQEYDFD